MYWETLPKGQYFLMHSLWQISGTHPRTENIDDANEHNVDICRQAKCHHFPRLRCAKSPALGKSLGSRVESGIHSLIHGYLNTSIHSSSRQSVQIQCQKSCYGRKVWILKVKKITLYYLVGMCSTIFLKVCSFQMEAELLM